MSLFLPPTAPNLPEWVRKVAVAVNALLRVPFQPMDTAPPDPTPGQAYFDKSTGKARVWDGSAWQNLW